MKSIPRLRTAISRAVGAMVIVGGLMSAAVALAGDREQNLLNDAKATIAAFKADEEFPNFETQLAKAKAVLVVPSLVKAALGIGGEGGRGVLMARDGSALGWSYPAFYRMTGASVGLQLGAQESETVFLILTDEGLKQLMSDELKLGVDAGAAIVDAGTGLEGATTTNFGADILAYSRAEGLYLGASFEGAVVSADDDANHVYYGEAVSPEDIIMGSKASNAAADSLRAVLKGG